jgi:hypothetical protein
MGITVLRAIAPAKKPVKAATALVAFAIIGGKPLCLLGYFLYYSSHLNQQNLALVIYQNQSRKFPWGAV